MDVAGMRLQASSSPSSPSAEAGGSSFAATTAKPSIQSFLKETKHRQNLESSSSSSTNQAPWHQPSLYRDLEKKKKQKRPKASKGPENNADNDWEDSLNLDQLLTSLEAGKLCPSVHDLISILYKCRAAKKPSCVLRFYAYLCRHGLETHAPLGNYLVSTLVEFGNIKDALDIFNGLHDRNQSSWNSLITYFVKSGDFERAFSLYTNMCTDRIVLPSRHTLVALLKVCAKLKDSERGCKLHTDIKKIGCLINDMFVGSSLIDMYAKCGLVRKAQHVFDKLPSSDVVTWNALIGGYASQGYAREALDCFEQMQLKGVPPNAVTFVCSLKACVSIGAIHTGYEIHGHITKLGFLENDIVLGNAMVDMYAKCGWLTTARMVFDDLVVHDVISWTSLVTAYANADCNEEALACFKKMQLDGVYPNAVTYASSLKACGNMEAAELGGEIHTEITCKGLDTEHVIGTALVDMYAKCGFFDIAQGLFDTLLVQDVVSWNALIAGYIKHDYPAKALDCFKQMRANDIPPDAITFVCCLKACGRTMAADKGEELHTEISEQGIMEGDIIIGNALVDMYVKCGLLAKAQDVFDRLPVHNVATWNALIGGYAEQERGEEALKCLKQMQADGFCSNSVTLVCCLKACGIIRNLDQGQELHNEISMRGLTRDFLVGNALVDMYCKCGLLERAQEVFDNLLDRDVVSWTSLIAGYVECGCGEKALACFKQMQHEAVSPDALTFACSLRACGNTQGADKGQEIHAQIVGERWIEDLVVSNALVYMYARCGFLTQAHELFDNLTVRNVVSWNILIAGYAEHGHEQRAFICFEQMQVEGVHPIASTYIFLLKAHNSFRAPNIIKQLYAMVVKEGLDAEYATGSALVNAFSKCGLLTEAQYVFDKLPVRDEVSWTTLIAAYAEHEQGEEALSCLYLMEQEGFSLDVITLVCSLKACGSIGAVDKGQELHDQICRKGLLQGENILGRVLIDMYAKCGLIERARDVFDNLQARDVIAWSALIAGYAQFGKVKDVSHLFTKMIGEGEKPNSVTFLSVLNACSHAGMINSGQMYLQFMEINHGVVPTLEHYNCMVDLLSRAGRMEEALGMIQNLSFVCNHVVWQTFLSGCQKEGYMDIGKQVYKHIMVMHQNDASSFVCMSNIYADAGL